MHGFYLKHYLLVIENGSCVKLQPSIMFFFLSVYLFVNDYNVCMVVFLALSYMSTTSVPWTVLARVSCELV